MLEWPRFNSEINNFDPLKITISFIDGNKKQLSRFRNISLFGSVNWFNRVKNLTLNMKMC